MPQLTRATFLDLATIDQGDLETDIITQQPFDWQLHANTTSEQTRERIRDAQVVISNKVVLDHDLLQRSEGLKLICIAATGTNNVDLEAAQKFGIAVCNVTGYATPSVVQHVFGLILALTTRLNAYQADVASGAWQRSEQFCLLGHPIREIAGKRLGIVGFGELGRAVAKLATAFGMEVLIARRPGGPARPGRIPLNELLPQVDILSLHCPLTDATRNLIGEKELALMQPDALLINTARGGIVDEPALASALLDGRLGGAGIDVLQQEPPRDGSPLLQPGIPNLIVTPHIAWASRESRQRLLDEVAANIRAFLAGERRNRVV